MNSESQASEESVLFRPVKRRRFARTARPASEYNEEGDPVQVSQNEQDAEINAETETIRAPRNKPRMAGIVFSNSESRKTGLESVKPKSKTDVPPDQLVAVASRFVTHADQEIDVDRHMVDYIETELAKRRQSDMPPPSTVSNLPSFLPHKSQEALPSRQPASLGRIHEIDLGPSFAQQNAERTEIAIRRARGEAIPTAPEPTVKKVKKIRLGRDGKPRRPRGPKPRSDAEVEREKAVEEILRENKVGHYPDGPSSTLTLGPADPGSVEQNTDDIVAEQFATEFMDAMAARRRRRPAVPSGPAKPGAKEESRGPKLGGSRSARAQMRAVQEREKEKEKEGKK